MPRTDTRPVFINLLRIRLPITGVVSILHRVSGVVLTLSLPVFLYLLQQSLADPLDYGRIVDYSSKGTGRWLLPIFLAAIVLHFLAGIRHLLLDLDMGIARHWARLSAWIVLVSTALIGVLLAWGLA